MRNRRRNRTDASGSMDSLTDTVTNMLGIIIILILITSARKQTTSQSAASTDPQTVASISSAIERLTPGIELVTEEEGIPDQELLELLGRLEASFAPGPGTDADGVTFQQSQVDAKQRRNNAVERLKRASDELNRPFDEALHQRLLTLLEKLDDEVELSLLPDDLGEQELVELLERLHDLMARAGETTREGQSLTEQTAAADARGFSATDGIALADEQLQVPRRTLNVNAPIAKDHADRESHHFFIQGDKIVIYPYGKINDLTRERFRRELKNQRNHSFSGTIGPIDGWVGEYEGQVTISGNRISVSKWRTVFVPPASGWGEPLESCLKEGHDFQEYLAQLDPAKDRLFFDLYADSFGRYAEFEGVLVEQGFAVGVYFLPVGQALSTGSGGIQVTER